VRSRLAAGSILAALAWSTPSAAQTPDKEACVRAYEQAQRLQRVSRLVEAKEQLALCQASCPVRLQADCAQWLDEANDRAPTLLVDVRDAAGRPLQAVRVTMDDKLLAIRLDERPIPADPGAHVFRFEPEGTAPIVRPLTLREREKGRRISLQVEPAAAPPAASPEPPKAAPGPLGRWTLASEVSAAVGGVAAVSAAYFLIRRVTQYDALERCKPGCSASDVDAANRNLAIGLVSLAVAAAGGGAAAYLYFAQPPASAPTAGLALDPSGATAFFRGTF
jgi:hypothetical protein